MLKINNLNVTNWNTAKVTDMSNMFEQCKSLTSLNLASFNTNNCKRFDNIFNECNEELNVIIDKQKAQNMIDVIKDSVIVINP